MRKFYVLSLSIILSFACCTSLRNDVSSQNYAERSVKTFSEYAAFMSQEYDITCKMPNRFFDQKYAELWKIHENRPAGNRYNPILRSKDKDCLIMFPFVPSSYTTGFEYQNVPRNIINIEIRTALEMDKDALFDFNDHVTILAGKEARDMFNADSVFLYDISMDRSYKEKYTNCTGLIISKTNRPIMTLKLFFTDRGKKKEAEFIARLRKAIWYHEELN